MTNHDIDANDGLMQDELTLEQLVAISRVESTWLISRIELGLFPNVARTAGDWRLPVSALHRIRRMRQIERDFEAVPELAALVADLLEELDTLRARSKMPRPR
ncbi:MAG: chaperone modulator CbpM [Candidatus Macondimonas sp.]